MTDVEFYINWGTGFVKVPPPRNWKALQIEAIWTNGNPSATVQATDFEWVGENATKIYAYREAGITGSGPGILEGLPLQIKDCINNAVIIFDGIINLADASTRWECDMVKAPSRESGKIDFFNDVAAAYTFFWLRSLPVNSPGRIIPSIDFKKTPYAITEIPDYTQAMLCSVSLFLMVKELYDASTKMNQLIAELNGDAATTVATAGLSAGTLAATIAKVVMQIAYIVLIIFAMIQLLQDLLDNIIQRKKYKLCMTFKRGFERICQYFGWTFSTNILIGDFVDSTWMPRKTVIPSTSNPLNIFDRPADEGVNFPNNTEVYGHHDGTFKDFIQDAMMIFNGEIKIFNNVFYFNKTRSIINPNAWQIPNTSSPGYTFNLPDPHETNAAELASSYFIIWATDPTELNTIHRYRGTSVQVLLQPAFIINKKNLLLGGSTEVRFQCSMARRKDYLTRIELLLNAIETALATFVNTIFQIINAIVSVINTILSWFGGNAPQIPTIPLLPTNTLGARVDWLALSNDSFSNPKAFIGKTGNGGDWIVHPQSETRMSALRLLTDFHGVNLATRGAQAYKYRDKRFKFCCQDYLQILFSNYVKDPTGVYNGEMLSLKWDRDTGQALNAHYKIYRNFTNNLTEKIIVDGAA